METTPIVTKTVALANTSPLTVAMVIQETNSMGNVSRVGNTGTEHFTTGSVSESDGNEPQSPVKALAVTPKKTVLPEDYDSETGSTPYDDWRILNHRVNCSRPSVPGHTSTPSKWPGPFYVDTPPSSK